DALVALTASLGAATPRLPAVAGVWPETTLRRLLPRPRLRQIDRQFRVHTPQSFVDDPHLRAMAEIEQAAHGVLGHAELFGELELGPAPRAHGLVNGELGGHQRRQDGAVRTGMRRALPRQRLAGFHIALERRDDAI